MTFDEFRDQLDKIRADFAISQNREMMTIGDLYAYLDRREVQKSKKNRGLRSLKGFNL